MSECAVKNHATRSTTTGKGLQNAGFPPPVKSLSRIWFGKEHPRSGGGVNLKLPPFHLNKTMLTFLALIRLFQSGIQGRNSQIFQIYQRRFKKKKEKKQTCKPGSVSRKTGTSIIYLAVTLLLQSSSLPLMIIRTGVQKQGGQPCERKRWSWYIWLCNPWDVRLSGSPPKPVSSYITFSPLSGKPDGYFLLRY